MAALKPPALVYGDFLDGSLREMRAEGVNILVILITRGVRDTHLDSAVRVLAATPCLLVRPPPLRPARAGGHVVGAYTRPHFGSTLRNHL